MWTASPPAVLRRLGHKLHLKCLAFWCCIKTGEAMSVRSKRRRVELTFLVLELPFTVPTPWSEELYQGDQDTRYGSHQAVGCMYLLVLLFGHLESSCALRGGGRREGDLSRKVHAPGLPERRLNNGCQMWLSRGCDRSDSFLPGCVCRITTVGHCASESKSLGQGPVHGVFSISSVVVNDFSSSQPHPFVHTSSDNIR